MTTILGSPARLRDRVIIAETIHQSEEIAGDIILPLRPLLLRVDMIMTNLHTVLILDYPDHPLSQEEENQGGEAATIMPLLEIMGDPRMQVGLAVDVVEGEALEVRAEEAREAVRGDPGQYDEVEEEGEGIEHTSSD